MIKPIAIATDAIPLVTCVVVTVSFDFLRQSDHWHKSALVSTQNLER